MRSFFHLRRRAPATDHADHSGTALFTCTKGVDYFITFCPSDDLYDDTACAQDVVRRGFADTVPRSVLPDGSTISQGSGTPASTVAVGETGAVTGGGGGDATKTAAASGGGAAPSATGGKSDGSTTLAAGSAGATTGPSNSASIGASKTVGGGAAGELGVGFKSDP